jgi:5-methylcytosine-specific restriction enzyme subunit McrC
MEGKANSRRDPLGLSPRALYFLLAYAWDLYDPLDEILAAAATLKSPADLLFHALAIEASRIFRRGPFREYVEAEYIGPTVRGRLDVAGTLREDLGRSRIAVSMNTKLSPDCPHNRVIKAALAMAMRLPGLDPTVRERARLVEKVFPGRALIGRIQAFDDIRAARLHRNNGGYRRALGFAKLILISMKPAGSAWRFTDPFDRARMNRLFEQFLRNFYRREVGASSKVGSEVLRWSPRRNALLPDMRTDITIRGADHCMVIDAKYYRESFAEYHGKHTIRSGHLYQIHSYCRVSATTDLRQRPWSGALVYARSHEEFKTVFDLKGFPIQVIGLDLETSSAAILDRLRSIWTEYPAKERKG